MVKNNNNINNKNNNNEEEKPVGSLSEGRSHRRGREWLLQRRPVGLEGKTLEPCVPEGSWQTAAWETAFKITFTDDEDCLYLAKPEKRMNPKMIMYASTSAHFIFARLRGE